MTDRYEGIVEYFRLSNKKHRGPYSNSKEIPIISVGIKNEQDGLREFELPINISNNPFLVRLIESELTGQRATYELKYQSIAYASGQIWNFQVNSGKFQGVNYTLEELVDD